MQFNTESHSGGGGSPNLTRDNFKHNIFSLFSGNLEKYNFTAHKNRVFLQSTSIKLNKTNGSLMKYVF